MPTQPTVRNTAVVTDVSLVEMRINPPGAARSFKQASHLTNFTFLIVRQKAGRKKARRAAGLFEAG
jgi:hypothetical protein